jgi:hypothetical protein
MRIEGDRNRGVLEIIGVDASGRGRRRVYRFDVSASCDGFQGENSKVEVRAEDLERFCEDVVVLEAKRRGGAMLASMCPGWFVLELAAVDGLGQIIASVQIKRLHYFRTRDERHFQQMNICFELDSERIGALRDMVIKLKDECREQ